MQHLAFLFVVATIVACAPVPDEYGSIRSMENPELFEGDIMGIDPNADRNAITHWMRLWPRGVIPYIIEPELKEQVPLIEKAMRHIEEHTCVRFRPMQPGDSHNIKIYKGKGCGSLVGMMTRNQLLSLGEGCYVLPLVAHELLHAVGFYHEHSRSDRDDYIDIHWDNIQPRMKRQFVKLQPSENKLFDSFDYNSVMLYGEMLFSKDASKGLKTITAKKPGVRIQELRTKPGLSKSDIYRVNQLYKCKKSL